MGMSFPERFRNLFFPREANNYQARILHPGPLSLVVGLFLFFQSSLNLLALVVPSVLGYASNITPEKIVELTNQKRAEVGLPALTLDPLLSEAAQRKAGDMFAFNYWAHNSPSGRDPWSFFKEVNYHYLYAGENLARDFADSEGVVSAWMASPTHKDNILNEKYQEIGVAVVNGTLEGMETSLVVQLFGTPVGVASRLPEQFKPLPQIGPEADFAFEQLAVLPETVLTKGKSTAQIMFNPFSLTRTFGIFILGLLAGIILMEMVMVRHQKIVRLSGRNLAHTAFLGAIILMILMMNQGAIL